MKKALLTISLVAFLTGNIFSQIIAPNPNVTAWDVPSTISVNTTIPITNTGVSDLDIRVAKIMNNLSGAHLSLFCFGLSCYSTGTDTSNTESFAAGTTVDLASDLQPHGDLGVSTVTYRIYDINNLNDYVDVSTTFNIIATGIKDSPTPFTLTRPQPNPADAFTSFTYNINGDAGSYGIKIINMLGKNVRDIKIEQKQGVLLVPTSDLQSGVYFYTLEKNGKVLATNKLIISHKN